MMKTEIIKINSLVPELELLKKAADVILNDGVIGYPTETVYGLGANALSSRAILNIFRIKGRDANKPILVIASDFDQINKLVKNIPDITFELADKFWPGPLTIVFEASDYVDKNLVGNGKSIGIRIPDNKICLELLKLTDLPITSTSANRAGGKNPIDVTELVENLGDEISLIIDGGTAQSRTPSTVLDLSTDQPIIRREGIIKKRELEQIVGTIAL